MASVFLLHLPAWAVRPCLSLSSSRGLAGYPPYIKLLPDSRSLVVTRKEPKSYLRSTSSKEQDPLALIIIVYARSYSISVDMTPNHSHGHNLTLLYQNLRHSHISDLIPASIAFSVYVIQSVYLVCGTSGHHQVHHRRKSSKSKRANKSIQHDILGRAFGHGETV